MAIGPIISGKGARLLHSAALTALALAMPTAAVADEADDLTQGQPPADATDEERRIFVTGERQIVSELENLEAEDVYDEDQVASYGASTVGEVLDNVARENGDEEPTLLINGVPVKDRAEIADYPVEAVNRVETLRKGSAARVGGASGQRVYNIVLKAAVRTITATGSRQFATEGDWGANKGELLFTRIQGADRINLALRASNSNLLLEAQRQVIQPTDGIPYAAAGNIRPVFGLEIDPLLSASAGGVVQVSAVPPGNTPTLADFVRNAGLINPNRASQFRSLRPDSERYEANLTATKQLSSWLSGTVTAHYNRSADDGLVGLPSTRFLIPRSNAFTPFTRDVYIALNDPERPLRSRSRFETLVTTASLKATFGTWRATLSARYDRRERSFSIDQSGFTLPTVGPATNPFAGTLAAQIPVVTRVTGSIVSAPHVSGDLEGPLFAFAAGTVRLRLEGRYARATLTPRSSTSAGLASLTRPETTIRAGLTMPLAGGPGDFLRSLGEAELSLDASHTSLGRFGNLDQRAAAITWQPLKPLRISAGITQEERAPSLDLLAAPTTVTQNIREYDPVRDETVEVTLISGGAAGLRNQSQRVTRLAATVSPVAKYDLQLQVEYVATDSRNQFGSVPAANAEVMAAFPDRFVRDDSGRLILIDTRSVNFTRQRQEQLRTGVRLTIPLRPVSGPAGAPGTPKPASGGPRPRLEANLSHTLMLRNEVVIRPDLAPIDLLEQGAIGIGSSRPRHSLDGSIALTDRGSGIRLNGRWRGATALLRGTPTAPETLKFESLAIFDLRAFVELPRLLPNQRWSNGARLSLAATNLLNAREQVRDRNGDTPLSFQPAYRDPIGRSIMVELRKVF